MNRQAQAVVLLLLGGAVVRATATDMHLRYVKPQLGPFLLAAGALLLAAGVMTLVHELRRRPVPAHDGPEPGDDHGHEHGGGGHHEPRIGWLLILPVLGLLLVAPPALGSYAAGQAGTALSSQQVTDFAPLPAGDPAKISVLDYASRAVFDKGASLGDRTVELTGFVATGPDGSLYLARIILSCCAADGRPIKVGMAGNGPAGLAPDSWVRVAGRYTVRTARDPVNDETIPFLDVETWEQIDPPKQQYE
ncbi:MAG TPA: TIGR03943 family protein [Pilimelia sp.]|nr:TIGR03943 family protein [Pilimelia sp.]